jgi:DNA adenine methylase
MKISRPMFKVSGEKWLIKDWIISEFPEKYEEMTYVEPYGGSVSVLFGKKKSKIEVINDNNLELVNIYKAIRDESQDFLKKLSLYKCTQENFEKSGKKTIHNDYLDQAVNDLFLRKSSKNGLKNIFQKPSSEEFWKDSIQNIKLFSQRINEVFIFGKVALEIISSLNTPDTLLYCDPPYLHDNKVSKMVYQSEMTTECHMNLQRLLNNFKGKVVLSGCMSPLYKRIYKDWNIAKSRVNKTSKEKKTEIIWKNF